MNCVGLNREMLELVGILDSDGTSTANLAVFTNDEVVVATDRKVMVVKPFIDVPEFETKYDDVFEELPEIVLISIKVLKDGLKRMKTKKVQLVKLALLRDTYRIIFEDNDSIIFEGDQSGFPNYKAVLEAVSALPVATQYKLNPALFIKGLKACRGNSVEMLIRNNNKAIWFYDGDTKILVMPMQASPYDEQLYIARWFYYPESKEYFVSTRAEVYAEGKLIEELGIAVEQTIKERDNLIEFAEFKAQKAERIKGEE